MKKKKKELLLFIAIFIITILLLRFWVLIIQEKSIYILGYEIHHMFIGIFLVLLSGFSRFFSKNKVLNKISIKARLEWYSRLTVLVSLHFYSLQYSQD